MNTDILWGILVGAVGMGALIYLGVLILRVLSRKGEEEKIQARLNKVLREIQEKETILQQELSHSSQVESDLAFMKLVCGRVIENTLVYFEQNKVIWGEKERDSIVAELHEALNYTGKERVTPVALLQHFNGGDHEQPTYT
ncbi:MAG: hypothetical protein KF802_16490 [Bdellovibrionaceae bacterium]|jgi:hypothetical protein|nr:hypothetical protein [Pseudobdellovibrionaceae bacterium]